MNAQITWSREFQLCEREKRELHERVHCPYGAVQLENAACGGKGRLDQSNALHVHEYAYHAREYVEKALVQDAQTQAY